MECFGSLEERSVISGWKNVGKLQRRCGLSWNLKACALPGKEAGKGQGVDLESKLIEIRMDDVIGEWQVVPCACLQVTEQKGCTSPSDVQSGAGEMAVWIKALAPHPKN